MTLSIPEVLTDEIQAWLARERERRPGVTSAMLMKVVAGALDVNERQVYRYMSGETPFPLQKAVVFCRAIDSWKLIQSLNQEAGLLAERAPDPGSVSKFDLIVEQSHTMKEFGEYVAAFADGMDERPSALELARIKKEGRDVIQTIERLIRCYDVLVQRQVKP